MKWLVALPFIIALAILASSQRMLNAHLQWQLTSPVRAVDGTAHLVQDYTRFGVTYSMEVTMTVLDVTTTTQVVEGFQTLEGPPGGVLWQIEAEFAAPPEEVLSFCEGAIVSDGVSYSPHAAKLDATTKENILTSGNTLPCTPAETPGPQYEFFGPGIEPAETPRPPRWRSSFSFALPAGVQPEELRVWWHRPVYLSFPLTGR